MPGILRVGDSVSCGDHAAQGSPTVFANGMPIVTQSTGQTTGHGCFPPSQFISGMSTTVFANNSPCGMMGAMITPHSCGNNVHAGTASVVSQDVFAES